MFLFGPPNVEKMKARRDVKGLIKALEYQKDSNIRAAAARALGELEDPRAVEPLIAALKDAEWRVRLAAAESLGKIGDARAVKPLIAALQDDSTLVVATAAKSLGQLGDISAAASLVNLLTSESQVFVCLHAAEALDKLGWKPDNHDKSAVWYFITKNDWKKCVEIGLPAVEPLIAILEKVGSVKKNIDAAWALGMIGDIRAVKPLINALRTAQDERVRWSAAKALGKIGHSRAVQPLIDALQDKEWSVRSTAAEALISIYRRGGLEDKTKTKILALRDKVAAMHTDEHTDKADCDDHTDIRVSGIEFLL
jgi:HEAT repeat protein